MSHDGRSRMSAASSSRGLSALFPRPLDLLALRGRLVELRGQLRTEVVRGIVVAVDPITGG